MTARIYQRPKNAMQSGKALTDQWILEFAPAEAKRPDPLMGWAGSGDMQQQVVLTFHVKLPIFVARQWIRHRTANVNEYSARYSVLDREFYIPSPEHLAAQSVSNRQGRGDFQCVVGRAGIAA